MTSPTQSEVRVYESPDGEVRVDGRLDRETVWLTQHQMADLFGRERSVVTQHIRNAFKEGELDPGATSAKFAQVRIGTLLFLDYLRRNGLLRRADGGPRLADNAMVALALLVAESEASQKDQMIRLVLSLLGDDPA